MPSSRLLFWGRRAHLFDRTGTTLGIQSAYPAGSRGTSSLARNSHTLPRLQTLSHALVGRFSILVLRAPFRRSDGRARWPMDEPHAGFNLVPMLSTGSTGN